MEKLNIAEILKDCPKGMELDCTCADNVVFDKIIEYDQIKCVIGECRDPLILDKYGRLLHICCPKCIIFPKGKTTWEGFQRPFKDGDVVINASNKESNAFIYKGKDDYHYKMYVGLTIGCVPELVNGSNAWVGIDREIRFATEEEKQKLFNAIKANGYKWNAETKTLEKLIVPKFKVGDRIKYRCGETVYRIVHITEDSYVLDNLCSIPISIEHMYDLVPNKFDITTLKAFESRVLVRDSNEDTWRPAIFGAVVPKTNDGDLPFVVVGGCFFGQCIPYENNKHLLGTTKDCEEYYKTWE